MNRFHIFKDNVTFYENKINIIIFFLYQQLLLTLI